MRSTRPRLAPSSLLRAGVVLLATLLPGWAAAVVCQFTPNMPTGKQPVGHALLWTDADADGRRHLVQWWYPAERVKDSMAASYVYSDYIKETLQTEPLSEERRNPEHKARMDAYIRSKKEDRGVPWVRFDHLMAATMLAARETTPIAGDWPVIWLDGDPSFADQLASHGFIVVSSPVPPETEPTQDDRVEAARIAIEATRTRFKVSLSRMGFVGFRDSGPLAARLSGLYPQSAGLALIGAWAPLPATPRRNGPWLDPNAILSPTLYLVAGATAPTALTEHPLKAPFSSVDRVYFADVDDVHLEFGQAEFCAPRFVVGRTVPPLTQVLTQREVRLRLAGFFAKAFGTAFEPAPLKLMPLHERQRQPLNMQDQKLAARIAPPPGAEAAVRLLARGGVDALLAKVPAEALPLLPPSWWKHIVMQTYATGDVRKVPALLKAWQKHQPGSATAAVLIAEAAARDGGDAVPLWKEARRLLKNDPRLSPGERRALQGTIDAARKAASTH
jgi:hypothetical protein